MEEQTDQSDRLNAISDEIHGLLQEILIRIAEGSGLRDLTDGIASYVVAIDKQRRHLQSVKGN